MSIFASPEIEGLDGASISVEESPENADLPSSLKQCIVTIKRDGKAATTIRLRYSAVYVVINALKECFSATPGAVTK